MSFEICTRTLAYLIYDPWVYARIRECPYFPLCTSLVFPIGIGMIVNRDLASGLKLGDQAAIKRRER